MIDKKIETKFLANFSKIVKKEFFNFTPFEVERIGFSLQKKLKNGEDNYISLVKVAILDEKDGKNRSKLYVGATYGEWTGSSVVLRTGDIKLKEPLDLESRDEYSYDKNADVLYCKNKVISGEKLVKDFYERHTKSTRTFKGIYLRRKIWFWRVVVKSFFEFNAKILEIILYLISGTKYSYDPFMEAFEEEINDYSARDNELEPTVKEATKIDFLGYKTSRWSIVAYSATHFMVYIIFYCLSYFPKIIATTFRNNFLTLLYVVVSLAIFEMFLPSIFKLLIKRFSTNAVNSGYKNISVK